MPSTPDDLWLQTIITFYYKAVSYLDNCGSGRVTGCASQFVQLILMIRNLGGAKLESVVVLSQARAIKKKGKKKQMAVGGVQAARLCFTQRDSLPLGVNK